MIKSRKIEDFMLRTMLYIPSQKLNYIESASNCNADTLVLDLEDSCQPDSNKIIGRENIVKALKSGIFGKRIVLVRINPRKTGFMFDDLNTITSEELDGIHYPMTATKEDVIFLDNLLTEIEMSKGFEVGKFKIFPVIETGQGLMNALEIAQASKRNIALGFGGEDFATDIGCIRDKENISIQIPRQTVVFAARSTGIPPIDTPHIDVHDLDGLDKHVAQARLLGFEGIQMLSPKEIEICHKHYTPTFKEIEEAREMVSMYDDAIKKDSGVVIVNKKFVSPPTYKRALKLLERHDKIERYLKLKNEKNEKNEA